MNLHNIIIFVMALLTVTSCKQDGAKTDSAATDSPKNTQVATNDEKPFKTFTFGNKVWMVENLKVKADGSRCEGDCNKFGRLYDWNTAMKACPEGWHLPAMSEFDSLLVAIFDTTNFNAWQESLLGKNTILWSSVEQNADSSFAVQIKNVDLSNGQGKTNLGGAGATFKSSIAYELSNGQEKTNLGGAGATSKSGFAYVRCVQGSPINDSLWLKQQEQKALNLCGRSAADIIEVVRQKTPGLRQIYNKALKKKKNFQGKVKIKFVIKPEGNVAETSVDSSTTGNDAFDNEISAAVKLWNFGKHKCNDGNLANVTTVTIPFTFSE